MRHGVASLRGRHHRHPVAMVGMPSERRLDRAGAAVRLTPDEGPIVPQQRARAPVVGEDVGEAPMGTVRLGRDHQPGRVLVEPVHDAGAAHAADARQAVAAMAQQGVDQSAGGVTGRRMHHEPRGLVDDDHVLVLEDDGQRDVLRLRRRIDRRRHLEEDPRALLSV